MFGMARETKSLFDSYLLTLSPGHDAHHQPTETTLLMKFRLKGINPHLQLCRSKPRRSLTVATVHCCSTSLSSSRSSDACVETDSGRSRSSDTAALLQ